MTMTPPESEPNWRSDSVSSITDALGELKIDHTAIGEQSLGLWGKLALIYHSTIHH
jgi:hypothetical protein